MRNIRPLTDRQRDIWVMLSTTRLTYAEIGEQLGISGRTVGKTAEVIRRKLGVVNRWGERPSSIAPKVRTKLRTERRTVPGR